MAESCSARLKLESRVVGPRDKSRFLPDKDGPKMGMGFFAEEISAVCLFVFVGP